MAGVSPKIIRENRMSISLRITRDGEVVVKAPRFAPDFVINQFLQSKREWIDKTLTKVKKPTKRKYVDGEEFLFLGSPHKLTFYSGIAIIAKDGKLFFPKALAFRIQKEIENWFIKQARDIIGKRVVEHAKRMRTTYNDIFFSDTSSKWGTCFPDNTLQFNWRLVMTPLLVIDYVVIHELTHVSEKHHQQAFWHRVGQFSVAFRQHRKWLRDNQHLLST